MIVALGRVGAERLTSQAKLLGLETLHNLPNVMYSTIHASIHNLFLALGAWTVRVGGGQEVALAFVMINAEAGSEREVLKELREIEHVKEAYIAYGVYDLLAKVEAETMDKLREVVASKLRRLNHVRSTLTMIVMERT